MVQLNTIYDKTLKEKIFILKGEEGYARSTDCILDEILHDGERRSDWDTHIEYMLLEFRVDVLRDIGASYVVLYDNDEVLGSYPFDTNSHHIDFKYEDQEHDNRLKFDYGVEHNLYAKYMGNKNCLKSKSKIYTFNEPLPRAYTSTLSFRDLNTNYDTGTISFDVVLNSEDGFVGKTIKVYKDSSLFGEYVTEDDGSVNVEMEINVEGLHKISAVFEGDSTLSYSECSQDISVGYKIDITDYPLSVLNTGDLTYTATVKDYLDKPVSNLTVSTMASNMEIVGDEAITDTNGSATLTIPNSSFNSFVHDDKLSYLCKTDNTSSSLVETNWYQDAEVSFTSKPNYITLGTLVIVEGSVSNVSSPANVELTYNNSTDFIKTNVITDSNGNFSYKLQGRGAGLVGVTATIPNDSETFVIEDLLQIWDKMNDMSNIFYYEDSGTVRSEFSGWRFTPTDNISRIYFGQTRDEHRYESTVIEFKVVSTSGITKINTIPITFSANDVIRIETKTLDGKIRIDKNGKWAGSLSQNRVETYLEFESNNGYILLDKLRFRRL